LEGQIEFRTDYLPDEECLLLLQEADLIVNSYQATGEAASAAARFSLASGSPVLVTPIPIFDDLGDAVFRMPGVSPAEIAQGIVETLHHLEQDTSQCRSVRAAAVQWRNAHDFRHQGAILMGMIKALSHDLGHGHA
jgi:glycosyltransferase involved in cell wall biosynthesis